MTKADKIFKQIENKRKSINNTKRFISLNPLLGIRNELKETILRMENEIIELGNELDNLYKANN